MSPIDSPILVVGGGPVGLSLALFLEYWGMPCTILNTGAQPRRSPKGNTNNARTLEIFRQIGIIDDVRRRGLPSNHSCDVCFFTRFTKYEIRRHHMPSLDERMEIRAKAPATDQYVEPMYRCNHMYVEEELFKKVCQCKLVDVRFGYQATAFTQDEAGVTVTATQLEDDREFEFRAQHVVDCAGGRSIIRKGLDIRYSGSEHTEAEYMAGQFLNAWVRIPDLYQVAPALKDSWFNLAVNEDKSTRGTLGSMNGKDEFILITKAGTDDHLFTPEDVAGMVRRMIGDDDIAIEVISHNPWTAGAARVVDQYQVGRIFLAGDAAHLFTPVGGFGMNTGIDDAHNLAWKLAAVHKGWGGPGLLDSYELERQPIGVRNTTACQRSGSGWHEPDITDALEKDGPEGERARAEMAQQRFIAGLHFFVPEEDDYTGVQLGARYDGSPLIVSDGNPPADVWPDTFTTYVPSSIPGGRLPHLWLEDQHTKGASIFDRLGRGFTLIRVNAGDLNATALQTAAEKKGVPLEVLNVARPEAADLYGKRLLLVRPDGYIAWRGDRLPESCEDLLDKVCGFE